LWDFARGEREEGDDGEEGCRSKNSTEHPGWHVAKEFEVRSVEEGTGICGWSEGAKDGEFGAERGSLAGGESDEGLCCSLGVAY